MREEHPQLQRLVSRAEQRYYINDWHILEHPEPQWSSAFNNMPLDLVRVLMLRLDLVRRLVALCSRCHVICFFLLPLDLNP